MQNKYWYTVFRKSRRSFQAVSIKNKIFCHQQQNLRHEKRPASRASFCLFLSWGAKRRLCLNLVNSLRPPQLELLDFLFSLVKLVFQCEHPFSDKTDGYNWARYTMKNQDGGEICLKATTLAWVHFGLGTCCACLIRILLHSCLSRERENWASKRKALLAGWLKKVTISKKHFGRFLLRSVFLLHLWLHK